MELVVAGFANKVNVVLAIEASNVANEEPIITSAYCVMVGVVPL
jgi:hypothetical protein